MLDAFWENFGSIGASVLGAVWVNVRSRLGADLKWVWSTLGDDRSRQGEDGKKESILLKMAKCIKRKVAQGRSRLL